MEGALQCALQRASTVGLCCGDGFVAEDCGDISHLSELWRGVCSDLSHSILLRVTLRKGVTVTFLHLRFVLLLVF